MNQKIEQKIVRVREVDGEKHRFLTMDYSQYQPTLQFLIERDWVVKFRWVEGTDEIFLFEKVN